MPRTSKRSIRSTPPVNSDVMQATIAQLTRLPSEILRLHLSARQLVSTGTKATMARRLYEAIHPPPLPQTTSQVSQQLPAPPSLLATQPPVTMPATQPPVTLPATQPPVTLPATQPPVTLPATQPPVTLPATQPPVTLPATQPPVTLPATQPPPSSLDLALLLNQFIRQATSGQTVPAALSPASIDGNTDANTGAHHQLLPSDAAHQLPLPSTAVHQQLLTSGALHQPSAIITYSQQLPQPTPQVQTQQVRHPQPQPVHQIQPPLLQPTPPVVQHSATVLQPSGTLYQPATQQYAAAAQHLPVPVPAELQQQIIRGEFVDFAVLLHKTSFVDAAQQTTQHYTHKPPAISSFSMWMQAWNIYLSVILTHNAARALELIGYQRIITSANQSLPLKAWLQYDGQFRTLAASNPHLRWDLRHAELWYEAMATPNTQRDTKRWPCPYCGAKNHFPENCPRSLFRDSSQYNRPPNRRAPGATICGDFNNGQCTRNTCNFQHICLSCKGPHPRVSCPDRRPTNQNQ